MDPKEARRRVMAQERGKHGAAKPEPVEVDTPSEIVQRAQNQLGPTSFGLFDSLKEYFGKKLAEWILELLLKSAEQHAPPDGAAADISLLRGWAADIIEANREAIQEAYNAQFDPLFDLAVAAIRS